MALVDTCVTDSNIEREIQARKRKKKVYTYIQMDRERRESEREREYIERGKIEGFALRGKNGLLWKLCGSRDMLKIRIVL